MGTEVTTVWIVIKGMYRDQTVEAIFSTVEKALAAYPDGEWLVGCMDDSAPDWISQSGLSEYHAITSYIIDELGNVRVAREQEAWLTKHPEFR